MASSGKTSPASAFQTAFQRAKDSEQAAAPVQLNPDEDAHVEEVLGDVDPSLLEELTSAIISAVVAQSKGRKPTTEDVQEILDQINHVEELNKEIDALRGALQACNIIHGGCELYPDEFWQFAVDSRDKELQAQVLKGLFKFAEPAKEGKGFYLTGPMFKKHFNWLKIEPFDVSDLSKKPNLVGEIRKFSEDPNLCHLFIHMDALAKLVRIWEEKSKKKPSAAASN